MSEAFAPTTSLALLLSASADPGGDRPQVIQIAQVEEALCSGQTRWCSTRRWAATRSPA